MKFENAAVALVLLTASFFVLVMDIAPTTSAALSICF